jgi:AcrR family transcriptional regulator
MHQAAGLDPRAARTRRAILDAFIGLVGDRPYDRFGVAEIVARAGIGRATFYDHYRGKDDLLHKSMAWLLELIASAAAPEADENRLRFAVAHFWDNRRLARAVLSHPIGPIVRRGLAAILERTHAPAAAAQIAGAQLALLEAWVRGEFSATQEEIVERLRAAARL